MNAPSDKAVLLLAYGSPDSLDDIPTYLANIRHGRPVPLPVVAGTVARYRQIGGRSPLLAITQSVASKLQDAISLPVYVGMRHWHPYVQETVQRMADDGEIIALLPAADIDEYLLFFIIGLHHSPGINGRVFQ